MSLLDQFGSLVHAFTTTAPWLVVHDLRTYLLIAVGAFIVLWLVDLVLSTLIFQLGRRIKQSYLGSVPQYSETMWSRAAIVLDTIFDVGYALTAYFNQLGLLLALFGIMAALDVFTERNMFGEYSTPGAPKPLPQQAQASLVQLGVIFDALSAALFGIAGILFQHFIVLA